MYAHIDGILAEKTSDALVIDVGGVGYELMVSGQTLSAAPKVGERMKCFTILSVREDAMELFGFATREEKAMYHKLRTVSGIGPRTALGILSALSVRDLSIALLTNDAAALARAPGVGKKTAQRLVLELRDKIDEDELQHSGVTLPAPTQIKGGAAADAIEALVALGYSSSDAQRAVAKVQDKGEKTDELIFWALRDRKSVV